jgi:diguanylate cyclase (GGDEF)-like protein/PAS domain S-box-containing protein
MKINTFLESGFSFVQEEYEMRLRHMLFNAVLSVNIFILSILSVVRFKEGGFSQSFADALMVAFCIFFIFYLRLKKENITKIMWVVLFVFFLFISYSFVNVNMHLVGASWFILFMLPAFYLGGKNIGLLVALLSLVSMSVLAFSASVPYTVFEYMYMITPFVMSIIFLYMYETRCKFVKALLLEKNLLLEKEVEIKTQEKTKLLQKSQELADIVDKSTIELYIIDFYTNSYLYANQGALGALGYSQEELLQKSIYDVNTSLKVDELEKLKQQCQENANVMNLFYHTKKDATHYGVYASVHKILYENAPALVIYATKISDGEKAQEEILKQKELLSEQVNYDFLTKLPNRALFYDRLAQAVLKAKRSHNKFALFFIDLDKFKEINDICGHDTGDKVLIETAQRLRTLFRGADTIARLAGDEFLAIIDNIKNEEDVVKIAQKTVALLAQPIEIEQEKLYVTCSVGISLFPEHTDNPKQLVKQADEAMYKAKAAGKNTFEFYGDTPCLR